MLPLLLWFCLLLWGQRPTRTYYANWQQHINVNSINLTGNKITLLFTFKWKCFAKCIIYLNAIVSSDRFVFFHWCVTATHLRLNIVFFNAILFLGWNIDNYCLCVLLCHRLPRNFCAIKTTNTCWWTGSL